LPDAAFAQEPIDDDLAQRAGLGTAAPRPVVIGDVVCDVVVMLLARVVICYWNTGTAAATTTVRYRVFGRPKGGGCRHRGADCTSTTPPWGVRRKSS
jgi:hypothetical protein